MHYNGIDVTDSKILKLLREDARKSYSDIGDAIGLSRVAVKNRILAMEEKGVIKGYTTIVDKGLANDSVQFLLDIETKPDCKSNMMHILGMKRMIHKVYNMSGECRIHAEGRAPSLQELNTFTDKLFNDDTYGVIKMSFNVILGTVKNLDDGIPYVDRRNQKENQNQQIDEQNSLEQKRE